MAQGKLGQVREAVDRPNLEPDRSTPTTTEDDDGLSSLFGQFIWAIFVESWASGTTDDLGQPRRGRFAPYPFANPDTGFILIDRDDEQPPQGNQPLFLERRDVSPWSVRASTEYGSDFDGVQRVGLRLFLDTASGFGVRTDWDHYIERCACGQRDRTWFGNVLGTYRLAQSEILQVHVGAGVRMLLDREKERVGGNFMIGFDVFHTKPFQFGSSLELGWLNQASALRWRVEGGINFKNVQLIGGYDILRINNVNLHGPFVGLRLWF